MFRRYLSWSRLVRTGSAAACSFAAVFRFLSASVVFSARFSYGDRMMVRHRSPCPRSVNRQVDASFPPASPTTDCSGIAVLFCLCTLSVSGALRTCRTWYGWHMSSTPTNRRSTYYTALAAAYPKG